MKLDIKTLRTDRLLFNKRFQNLVLIVCLIFSLFLSTGSLHFATNNAIWTFIALSGLSFCFYAYLRYFTNYTKHQRDARQEAEKAINMQKDFMANMSHELRTPMNGLLGLTEILQDTPLNGEQRECVDSIHTSGTALLTILNDILDLSKIEAGEFALDPLPFELKTLIHNVKNISDSHASKKGLLFNAQIDPKTPKWFLGDHGRVQQILINLTSNALKFTNEGGVNVFVDWRKDLSGPYLYLEVADTGIGIPDDFKHNLYNKFSQADTTIARRFGGTGLGLTITRHLVHMMEGDITFKSTEGKGTTFMIKLPLPETEPPHNQKEAAEAHKNILTTAMAQNARILVVEDHPINQMLVEKWLNKLNIGQIDMANNGFESLSYIRNNRYSLILMDCQMPELDGYETTTLIRDMEKQQDHRTPIIAMTANAMVGEREKCLEVGMDDYLSKPLNFTQLCQTLERWLSEDPTLPIHTDDQAPTETLQPANDVPVNLDRLYEFTDGDKDLEENIIGIFIEQSHESLQTLQEQFIQPTSEEWRKAAHRLKGASGNLGADNLYQLCAHAETLFDREPNEKEAILHQIQTEFNGVEQFLQAR